MFVGSRISVMRSKEWKNYTTEQMKGCINFEINNKMKYRIAKYQVIYDNGSRDSIKLDKPIHTDDYESVRIKLRNKHSGHGKHVVGVNLDYEEFNSEKI